MAVNINVPSQVKTYTDLAAFPASGALKTIYIAEDTNKTYRWTGSVYVEVSAAGASGITIGTTAITSGTVGRVLFEGTGNVVQESGSLFWDNTNGRLGIGTASPASTLDVNGTIKSSVLRSDVINNTANTITLLQFTGTGNRLFDNSGTQVLNLRGGNLQIGTTTDAGYRLDVNGTARVSGILSLSSATGGYAYLQDTSLNSAYNVISLQNTSGAFAIISRTSTGGYVADHYGIVQTSAASSYQRWFTSGVERMRMDATGNVGIGTSSPAFRLEVQGGDVRFANGLTIGTAGSTGWQFSSNTVTLIQNGFLGVDVANGRQFSITNTAFSTTYFRVAGTTGNILINTTTDAGYKLDVNGTARVSGDLTVSQLRLSANALIGFNGVRIRGAAAASIGGTSIGNLATPQTNVQLYVLGYGDTSATNSLLIRNSSLQNALQIRDDRVIIMEGVPTSSAGLPTGAIWNDAGTLKIV